MEVEMRKMLFLLFLIFSVGLLAQTPVSIYDIQYTEVPGADNTYPSPYEGQEVITTGIVTVTGIASFEDNFIISMPDGGAWSALYVYKANWENNPNGNPIVSVGDEVEVTGYIAEYYGYTELSGQDYTVTVAILSTGNPVPSIIELTADVISTSEQYESVIVKVNDITCLQEPDSHGQWLGNDGTGICVFDDQYLYWDNWDPEFIVSVGDTFEAIQGFIVYSYDNYCVCPRGWDDINPIVSNDDNTIIFTSQFLGCYPNPFNPETNALLSLQQESKVMMVVYNIKGEKVKTLVNENLPAGMHTIPWNGTDKNGLSVASGIYFFKTDARDNLGDYTSLKKVILLK